MPKTFKFLRWSGKKAVAFLVLTLVLAVAAVGSTLAYIIVKTNSLENQFTPPEINIQVVGDNIANKSDFPVYVRATVVVNWVSNDGQSTILSAVPVAGTDYTIDYNDENGWFQGADGFWYYTNSLGAQTAAPGLLNITEQLVKKDGYELRIQVVSAIIQATPTDAVAIAWPAVKVDGNGNLTPAN